MTVKCYCIEYVRVTANMMHLQNDISHNLNRLHIQQNQETCVGNIGRIYYSWPFNLPDVDVSCVCFCMVDTCYFFALSATSIPSLDFEMPPIGATLTIFF